MEIYWLIATSLLCLAVIISALILFVYYVEYKKSTGGQKLTFTFLIALLLFMASLPLVIPLLLFLALFSRVVSLILKLKHGSEFGGLLDGTDAIHTVEGRSKNVGNILFIVHHNDDQPAPFHDAIKTAIIQKFSKGVVRTPKLWFTLRHFLGYSYYVKNQASTDDCVRKLETLDAEELTRDDCVKLVSKLSNQPLPKEHTALWEVLIGTQPVRWKPNGAGKCYPVVLRIHHCLTDAASFVKVFIRIFGDVKSVEVSPPPESNFIRQSSTRSTYKVNEKITIKLPTTKEVSISSKPFAYLWNVVNLTVKSTYVMLLLPVILLVQTLVKAKDRNILQGPALSGEKVLAFGAEELPHYVQAIKHIKGRVPGTSSPDVLLAAISASFTDYFGKNSKAIPEHIAGLIPLFPPPSQLPHFIPQEPDVKKIVCRNVFSLAVLKLPLSINDTESSAAEAATGGAATKRLVAVKEQIEIFKNAIDYQANYLLLMFFIGILPLSLRKLFAKLLHCTFIISIVPAPSAMTVLDGYAVKDVVFWIPNIKPMGIGFSVFSYDKRLQIGLIADKALIPDAKDAQGIVDGIYKYLDLLSLETDFSRL